MIEIRRLGNYLNKCAIVMNGRVIGVFSDEKHARYTLKVVNKIIKELERSNDEVL